MAAVPSAAAGLSDTDREQLKNLLDAFGGAWNEQALAAATRKLPPAGNPLRLPALIGLVQIDLERQWQRGRRPTVEGFLHFYPELGTRDSVPAELVHTEFQARQRHGGGANIADFRRRFPNQADALLKLMATGGSSAAPAPVVAAPVAPPAPAAATSGEIPEEFGHYKILKEIGRGGMGTVYLALDMQANRRVALKVANQASEGTETLERFLREARHAGALDHPNLCAVLDSGEINGRHFLTMAFIDGPTLSAVLKKGRMPVREAAELVRKLALALQTAHAKGVIHRDLKPGNVMLTGAGEPVITDFGLARGANDVRATVSGQMLGTPAYMPPEQVMGDVDGMGPPCDIYSLGVLLYELLTGVVPFRGDLGNVMRSVLNKAPDPPSKARSGIDDRLDAICLKALAKTPEHRFGSMTEFAEALSGYLDGREVAGLEVPMADLPPMGSRAGGQAPFRRRHKHKSGGWVKPLVATAVVLAVLTGGAFLIWNLAVEKGTIALEVADPDVTLLVDGKEVKLRGKSTEPLNLPTGTHSVVARRGEAEAAQEFTVKAGRNKPFKVELPARDEPPAPPPVEEKFVPMFNGMDLSGWKVTVGEERLWQVNPEGDLTAIGPGPGWLLTEQSFSDFELKLEYRMVIHTASGISLRAPETGDPARDGIRIRLIDHSHRAPLPPNQSHGALADIVKPEKAVGHTYGDWHKLTLQCRGPRLTMQIDGQPVLTAALDSLRAYESRYPGLKSRKGRIGLECDQNLIAFRNIEVKELHDTSRSGKKKR